MEAAWYEPTGRIGHSTAVVGQRLFLWAGNDPKIPHGHDSAYKRESLSHVDVFHLQKGIWEQQTTSGTPPLGVRGYACVAVESDLYYFSGYCGHGYCYHNSVHKLSTSSLQWRMLFPTTKKGKGPMKKVQCGILALKDDEEDFLFVVGGNCPTPSLHQSGAQYEEKGGLTYTNEQHMFFLKTRE